jgi:ABC-type dipeptide/oligopeptide/nickel transport system ATPase component
MMATGILVIGESGSGKSTSVRNLKPEETYIVNVQGKPLPWRGSKDQYNLESKNMTHVDNSQKIGSILHSVSERAPHINTVVVDDFQYIMVNEMMRRSKETGYTKFTEIARGIWDLINLIPTLREDLKVVFLSHVETTSLGKEKVKTVGKMLDDQVNIEGMFTIVLKAICHNGEYLFSTKNSGMDTVKTPMGMFEADTIQNDLVNVIECINNY